MNENFWLKQAKELSWVKFPKKIFSKNKNFPKWYEDGELDVYYNLIERHIKKKIGIFFVDSQKKIKFLRIKKIHNLVNIFCRNLKNLNNKNLNKVMLHTSSSIESSISMLSCVRLGIHFSVIFEELSLFAIKQRIKLFEPDIFITKDEKIYKLLKSDRGFKIEIVLFKSLFDNKIVIHKEIQNNIAKSTDKFFTLFTSGTTGMPKGVTHGHGGYLTYSNYTCRNQFGLKKNSIMFTASDAGWINGHTYALFGPLTIGCSTVLIEKPALLIDEKLLIRILKKGVQVLYLPVTIIRMMKAFDTKKFIKIKTLKTLGSMGEPLAYEVGHWFAKKFLCEHKSIINTYFQTETGGIICSPTYKDSSKKIPHGSVGKPTNKSIKINLLTQKKKEFIIKNSWPGIMQEILNKEEFIWKKYWTRLGHFRMFDIASIKKKNIYIHGRNDDVINIRGHRIGSAEIEAVILKNENIIEACAVSINDNLDGNALCLFVIAKKNINPIISKLIIESFGSYAIPRMIIYLKNLPKTRSGKIVRRLLREIVAYPKKKEFGDLSTLIYKGVISEIRNEIKKQRY